MMAAALIAALVGCGLISLAIRSHLAGKRKSEAPPVLNRDAIDAPALAPTHLDPLPILSPACQPVESEVLAARVFERVASPAGETALPLAEVKLAWNVDSAAFTSAAINIHADTAEVESPLPALSEPRPDLRALKLPNESEAPPVNELAGPPGIWPRENESISLAEDGQWASRAKVTPSAATAFLVVAPGADEAHFESIENGTTKEDASPADAAVDAKAAEASEAIVLEPGGVEGGGVPPTHPRHHLMNEDELLEDAATVAIALVPPVTPAAPAEAGENEGGTAAIAQYRPPMLTPPAITRSRATRSTPTARISQSSLEVRLQLMISRAGDVHAAFLFRRPDEFPASLSLKVRSNEVALSAYGDGWYVAEMPGQSFVADALAQGFLASERVNGNARTSWMLSAGREIYVTATQPGLGGYYFAPRLVLGRIQFVLVREHHAAQVMQILADTCGKPVRRFAQDQVPLPGWALLGPALPLKSLGQQPSGDSMNVLRPLPELSILLEGGLCLRGAEWLQGFPPRISIAGSIPEGERVLIDGLAASVDPQGAYEIPGYDSVGDHTIWCAGVSRSYTISSPPQSWEPWRAHDERKGSVCGALSDYQAGNPQARLTTVPCSNTVLIGAEPGQVYGGGGQGGEWTGIVPFMPVWAVPTNPFQCRKDVARIMLRAPIPVAGANASPFNSREVKAWCRAILDCQRKGLSLESPGGAVLWNGYVRAARAAWRSIR